MSLLDNQTRAAPGVFFPAISGGGGGGGGGNIVASTITLEGAAPITATLASAPNDGFEVRNGGGGGNVVVVGTIDEANTAQIEFGARTLSTIGGSTAVIGRFEMTLDGLPTDGAALTYTLDRAASGTASTIGSVTFAPGVAPATSLVTIKSEAGAALQVGNGQISATPVGTNLIPAKSALASGGNIYVPATGATQTVAAFSTTVGHAYEVWVPNLRVQNQPAGAPTAGAWSQLTIDTSPSVTYVDTFDMTSVSTIANDLQKSASYSFVATAAGHLLQATCSAGALSTAFTLAPAVYLRDLGAPANFAQIG